MTRKSCDYRGMVAGEACVLRAGHAGAHHTRSQVVRALHCIRCFDVVKNAPKQEPCGCGCHR